MTRSLRMGEKTNYQLSFSVRDGIAEIIIIGELTENSLDSLRAEVITIARENNAKAMLIDARFLNGPNEISQAYFRSRSVPLDVKILPAAIVELSEDKKFQSFYETTAANAGQSMRFFTDIDAARAWLRTNIKK